MNKSTQTSHQSTYNFKVGDKVQVISIERSRPFQFYEGYPESDKEWALNEMSMNDKENLNQIGTIVGIDQKMDEYVISFKTLPNSINGGDNAWPAENLRKVV